MEYLIDTNVASEPLRPSPNAAVVQRLRIHEQAIAVPAPVWHELRFGCSRLPHSRRREAIERYIEDVILACFPVIEYGQEAADLHAIERARLTTSGNTPPFVDGQIAAIAIVNGLTLVTSNTKDFRSFSNLRLESWI